MHQNARPAALLRSSQGLAATLLQYIVLALPTDPLLQLAHTESTYTCAACLHRQDSLRTLPAAFSTTGHSATHATHLTQNTNTSKLGASIAGASIAAGHGSGPSCTSCRCAAHHQSLGGKVLFMNAPHTPGTLAPDPLVPTTCQAPTKAAASSDLHHAVWVPPAMASGAGMQEDGTAPRPCTNIGNS